MSGSLNKVILIGRLGKDPEVRNTADGKAIVSLTIATSESWKTKDGERKEKTEWNRVVIFNEGLAKVAEQYLKKGSTVYLEGSLQTRKWMDKDGVEKFSTEVVLQNFRGELVMLGGKPEQDAGDAFSSAKKGAKTAASGQSFTRDMDDSIPFGAEFR